MCYLPWNYVLASVCVHENVTSLYTQKNGGSQKMCCIDAATVGWIFQWVFLFCNELTLSHPIGLLHQLSRDLISAYLSKFFYHCDFKHWQRQHIWHSKMKPATQQRVVQKNKQIKTNEKKMKITSFFSALRKSVNRKTWSAAKSLQGLVTLDRSTMKREVEGQRVFGHALNRGKKHEWDVKTVLS